MKALVTGATGFIGSHLVEELLRRGFDVSCLVRNTSAPRYIEGLDIRLISGDCTVVESLSNAVKGFDYIFHLAGLTKACSERDFYDVNVKGTENIIKAVVENNPNIERFVYVSSLAASGPACDSIPPKEDCELHPVSVYGRTKLEGERRVLSHKKDIPVTVVRPPAVYGPRDKDMLLFFKMVNGGIAPYWGKCYYSLIYVEDLINGIILSALNEEAEGEIFFVSDGNIYTSDDIINAIATALQKKPLKLNIPTFVMPIVGFVSEKIRGANIINSDKIKEMRHPYWICNSSKAASVLKFEPKVKIEEGVKWTADWYKTHRWL